jgi:hypothetical protein
MMINNNNDLHYLYFPLLYICHTIEDVLVVSIKFIKEELFVLTDLVNLVINLIIRVLMLLISFKDYTFKNLLQRTSQMLELVFIF